MTIQSHMFLLETKHFSPCDYIFCLTLWNLLFNLLFFFSITLTFSVALQKRPHLHGPLPALGPCTNGIWKVCPNSWAFDVGLATWFPYWLFKIISTIFFSHGIWFSICTLEYVSPENGKTRWVFAFFPPHESGWQGGRGGGEDRKPHRGGSGGRWKIKL